MVVLREDFVNNIFREVAERFNERRRMRSSFSQRREDDDDVTHISSASFHLLLPNSCSNNLRFSLSSPGFFGRKVENSPENVKQIFSKEKEREMLKRKY